MRRRLFQLPSHVKPATRIAIAAAGFVLVHIAAWFLFTASAPYAGSLLGILGLLLFLLGSGKPTQKQMTRGSKHYYFKA